MARTFDPYHRWLGIRPEEPRPISYYRLLGLAVGEDDPDVIQDAADQRMAHVRTHQTGPHSAVSQRILNELAAARVCLSDPQKRATYNATLAAQQAPQPAIEPIAPLPLPQPQYALDPLSNPQVRHVRPQEPVTAATDTPRTFDLKRVPKVVWFAGGAGAIVLLLVLVLVVLFAMSGSEPQSPIAGQATEVNSPAALLEHPSGQIRDFRHMSTVGACDITPDGRRALSGCYDGTIRLWNLESGELLREMPGHEAPSWGVIFLPDGRRAASSSLDGKVCIWDLETGEALHEFTGLRRTAKLSCSPDGRFVFAPGIHVPIRVFDVVTNDRFDLPGPFTGMVCTATSPDGKLVAAGGQMRVIPIWNFETRQIVLRLEGHRQQVDSLAWLPDGKHLISGSYDGSIKLWDLETGEEVRSYEGNNSLVKFVAVSGDGKRLLGGGKDRVLRLWDVESGELLESFSGHKSDIESIAVSADGLLAVSSGMDSTMRLWRLPGDAGGSASPGTSPNTLVSNQPAAVASKPAFQVRSPVPLVGATLLDDGRRMLAVSEGLVQTWDLQTGVVRSQSYLGKLDETPVAPKHAVATPSGSHVLIGDGRTTWMVNMATGRVTRQGFTGSLKAAALAADGSQFLASNGSTVYYYPVNSPRPRRQIVHRTEHLAFASGMDALVAGGPGGLMLHPLRGGRMDYFGGKTLCLNRNGNRAVNQLIGRPGMMTVCDVKPIGFHISAEIQAKDRAEDAPLAMSPDGSRFVWFNGQHVAHVVDAKTGRTRFEVAVGKACQGVALSADNQWLLTHAPADEQHTVTAWKLGPTPAATVAGKLPDRSDIAISQGMLREIKCPDDATMLDAAVLDDGRVLASSSDGRVHYWHLSTGNLLGALNFGVAFQTLEPMSGNRMLSIDQHGALVVWNINDGRVLKRIASRPALVAVPLSDDRAVVSHHGRLRIYDLSSGTYDREHEVKKGTFTSLVVSPDESRIFCVQRINRVYALDLPTAAEVRDQRFSGIMQALPLPSNNDYVTISSSGVAVWNTNRDTPVRKLPIERGGTAALSPDGKYLLMAEFTNKVTLIETATGKPLKAHESRRTCRHVRFSPNGSLAVTLAPAGFSNEQDTLGCWVIDPGAIESLPVPAPPPEIEPPPRPVVKYGPQPKRVFATPAGSAVPVATAFLPGSDRLMEINAADQLTVWNLDSKTPQFSFSQKAATIQAFPHSEVVLLCDGKHVRKTWPEDERHNGVSQPGVIGSMTPDARRLAYVEEDQDVHVSDAVDYLTRPIGNSVPVENLAISPNAEFVLIAHPDKFRLYHLPRIRNRAEWPHGGLVANLAFTADSQYAVSSSPAGKPGKIALWDVANAQVVNQIDVPTPIRHLVLAPDGRHVLLAGEDRSVRIWDLQSGQEVMSYLHPTVVNCLAISHDGRLGAWGTARVEVFDLTGQADASEVVQVPIAPPAPAAPAAREPVTVKGKALPVPEKLLPPPDRAAQTAALELVRDVYSEQYKANPELLASELVGDAIETKDDAAARYVMLTEAVELAAASGRTDILSDALTTLSNWYQIEAATIRAVCTKAIPKARSLTQLADTLERFTRQAMAAGNYEDAESLAEVAAVAARKTRSSQLTARMTDLALDVRRAKLATAGLKEARQQLADNPDDPAANLQIGKTLALYQGDWTAAVRYLLKSQDPKWLAVARAEQAGPTSTEERIALGNAWWDLATDEPQHAKALQSRAAFWYKLAMRSADPKQRYELKKRVDQVEK